MLKKLLLSLLLFITFSVAEEIRVLGRQSVEDIGHSYFLDLIELTIVKSQPEFPFKKLTVLDMHNTTHGRTLSLLEKGFVDVFWAGTDQSREERFIPIRVPLFYGLLGYRVSIIHKDSLATFNQITKTPEKLKLLNACQGEHWPDSDILEDNGYNVTRVARFELMFRMLDKKRCDYFPRAIFEGYSELEVARQAFPNLIMFDDVILHYPFPIYFFIHKNNQELAEQIAFGLEKARQDGSLMTLMKTHKLSKNIFPLEKWQQKQFIHLSNQYLSKETPLSSQDLWFKLYCSN